MFHAGKCPKCDKTIAHAKAEAIELRVSPKEIYKGVSYLCPACKAVLGVEIDPIALKADIVRMVVERLGRG
jgi:uncharacterized protein with PIN domain